MKVSELTNGFIVALLLTSPVVGAETDYPAADFKPKVIFQDLGQNAKSEVVSKAPSKNESKENLSSESKYPASDFEPKVVFKDANYKQQNKSVESVSNYSGSSSIAQEEPSIVQVKSEDKSGMQYLLGLLVLAVGGYLIFGKREQKLERPVDTVAYTKHVSGQSGVARYLRRNNMAAASTGVAKYLESHGESKPAVASAKSGVEKYLQANQAKSENIKRVATGVEKYMRNRG